MASKAQKEKLGKKSTSMSKITAKQLLDDYLIPGIMEKMYEFEFNWMGKLKKALEPIEARIKALEDKLGGKQ